MGLAEDLKAVQDLRDKGEIPEAHYARARDTILHKDHVAPNRKTQSTSRVAIVIITILACILGLLILVRSTQVKPGSPSQIPVLPTNQAMPQFVPITNGALTVNAHSLSWYPFVVPTNARAVAVQGHFAATGGIGNDIIVYITDEDGLTNLKNADEARVYYNSRKVTQASISAVLPNKPGTYYLILDNRFSLITPKAVQVTATLSYLD